MAYYVKKGESLPVEKPGNKKISPVRSHDKEPATPIIAPSPAAHARTCYKDFCGCRAGEMASEIREICYAFGPQLKTFMSVGIWLKDFVVSCSSLSEVRQCRI